MSYLCGDSQFFVHGIVRTRVLHLPLRIYPVWHSMYQLDQLTMHLHQLQEKELIKLLNLFRTLSSFSYKSTTAYESLLLLTTSIMIIFEGKS